MQSSHREVLAAVIEHVAPPLVQEPEHRFLEELIQRFDEDPKVAKRAMRKLIGTCGTQLFAPACAILRNGSDSSAHEHLRGLLVETGLVVAALADPALFSTGTAIRVSKLWSCVEPFLDFKLLKFLFYTDATHVDEATTAKVRRVLNIIPALPLSPRIMPLLLKVERFPDANLRSQSILLFCRAGRNARLAERWLADGDARVRANVVEGLWTVDARRVLWAAAADAHHRVAANALIGLYYLEGLSVAGRLEAMAGNPDPMVRSAAVFAMGKTEDAHFMPLLSSLARDESTRVRGMALRALVRIRKNASAPPQADPMIVI